MYIVEHYITKYIKEFTSWRATCTGYSVCKITEDMRKFNGFSDVVHMSLRFPGEIGRLIVANPNQFSWVVKCDLSDLCLVWHVYGGGV